MANPNPSPGTRFKPGCEGGPGGPPGHEKAVTHGAYAYREHGELPEARRTPALVSRVDEIRENVTTRQGLEREQQKVTERALVSLDLALSWVKTQRDEGLPLDKISIFRMLPALLNSAGRALSQALDMKDRLGKAGPDVIDMALAAVAELDASCAAQGELDDGTKSTD